MVEAKKRRKPAEVRRREILRAAGKVLVSRGYHNVHLDDVAAAAGLSKGTLYLYFKDKESLFAEVLEDVIDRLEERLKAISMEGRALGSLERIAAEMLDFVDSTRTSWSSSRARSRTCAASAPAAFSSGDMRGIFGSWPKPSRAASRKASFASMAP